MRTRHQVGTVRITEPSGKLHTWRHTISTYEIRSYRVFKSRLIVITDTLLSVPILETLTYAVLLV